MLFLHLSCENNQGIGELEQSDELSLATRSIYDKTHYKLKKRLWFDFKVSL